LCAGIQENNFYITREPGLYLQENNFYIYKGTSSIPTKKQLLYRSPVREPSVSLPPSLSLSISLSLYLPDTLGSAVFDLSGEAPPEVEGGCRVLRG